MSTPAMTNLCKNNSVGSCFAKFKEPMYASDYITKKKMNNTFCNSKICNYNKVNSQSNLLMLKQIKYSCNQIDKTQLYINLITKLQLNNNIPVITYNATKTSPTTIEPNKNPVFTYTIDVSGNLFGNSVCTINNWENYVVYNNTH
jgi:hypothetical protein